MDENAWVWDAKSLEWAHPFGLGEGAFWEWDLHSKGSRAEDQITRIWYPREENTKEMELRAPNRSRVYWGWKHPSMCSHNFHGVKVRSPPSGETLYSPGYVRSGQGCAYMGREILLTSPCSGFFQCKDVKKYRKDIAFVSTSFTPKQQNEKFRGWFQRPSEARSPLPSPPSPPCSHH